MNKEYYNDVEQKLKQQTVSGQIEHVVSSELSKNPLQNIGAKSKMSSTDKDWLSRLSGMLYDEGWYTKSIYLQQMVDNAEDA